MHKRYIHDPVLLLQDTNYTFFWPKTAAHSKSCGQGHCRGEGTKNRCSTLLVVFSLHYRIIFSTPSNRIVDLQFVQEEQIPFAQFH